MVCFSLISLHFLCYILMPNWVLQIQATVYLLPGMHFLTSTIAMNQKDSFLNIKSLSEEEEVIVSGGMILDGEWSDGDGMIRGLI